MANNPRQHPQNAAAKYIPYLRSIARYPTDTRCNACPNSLTMARVLAQDYALSMIDNHPREITSTATRNSDGLTPTSIRLGLAYTKGYIECRIPKPWDMHIRTLGRVFWLDDNDHESVIVSHEGMVEYFNTAMDILDNHRHWIWDNRFCDTHDVFTANHRIKHIDG